MQTGPSRDPVCPLPNPPVCFLTRQRRPLAPPPPSRRLFSLDNTDVSPVSPCMSSRIDKAVQEFQSTGKFFAGRGLFMRCQDARKW